MNKRRILNTIVDIGLITIIFGLTDAVMLHLFHTENFWLEMGVYVVLYGVFFGAKSGIVYLWKRRK